MKTIPTLAELHDTDQTYDEGKIAEIFGRFNVKYKKSPNQNGVWTSNHVKYDVELWYDGEFIYKTTYQQPADCVVKIAEVWQCVLSDARIFQDSEDLADFLADGGYANGNRNMLRDGIAAYEGCKETWTVLCKKGIDIPLAEAFISFVDDEGYDGEAEAEEME